LPIGGRRNKWSGIRVATCAIEQTQEYEFLTFDSHKLSDKCDIIGYTR